MRSTYLELLVRYRIRGAHPGGLPLSKKLLDSLDINSSTHLLDLGCGLGQTLGYIAKTYPCKITGVDINKQMIFQAAKKLKDENLTVDLICADVTKLPFSSNKFDIALSESVTIFTEINKALSEYARILKNDGTLLAIEMTSKDLLTKRELFEIKSVYGIDQVPTSIEWERMLKLAGFTVIQSYEVKMIPTLKFTSLRMLYDFFPHLIILNRYKRKLIYNVYVCRKVIQ